MNTEPAPSVAQMASKLRNAVRAGHSISAALSPLADRGVSWLDLLRALRAAFTLGMAEAGPVGGWRTGTGELSDADLDELLTPEIEARRADWELLEPVTLQVHALRPVLRIFDRAKAIEFYVDYLGFQVRGESPAGAPTTRLELRRAGAGLALSGHHEDGCPGACVELLVSGLVELQHELQQRSFPGVQPQLEVRSDASKLLQIIDPFGNRLRFLEARTDG